MGMTPQPDRPAAVRAERAATLAEHLRRAQSGEREALDAIVRELNPLLWHVVRAQGVEVEASVLDRHDATAPSSARASCFTRASSTLPVGLRSRVGRTKT